MTWLQISLSIPALSADHAEAVFTAAGAVAITYRDARQDTDEQAIYEPEPGETPLWALTRISGLFPAPAETIQFKKQIQEQLAIDVPYECYHELIEDEDWERAWMHHFKPLCFGDRLWIIPEGYEIPDPTAVNIRLDPGLAFGTGTHETTALCLHWIAEHDLQDKTVIDYGCGSGILAIAAALCGASIVTAVDIDPQAITATRQNADKNQLGAIVQTGLVKDTELIPADTVIANILSTPLINLAPRLSHLVKPGGTLVLSGILFQHTSQNKQSREYSQADMVISTYSDYFSDIQQSTRNEWIRLVCRRSD